LSLSLSLSLDWRQSGKKSGARRGVYRRGRGAEGQRLGKQRLQHQPTHPHYAYIVFFEVLCFRLYTQYRASGLQRESPGGVAATAVAITPPRRQLCLCFLYSFVLVVPLFLFCSCLYMTVNVKARVGGKSKPTSYKFSLTPRKN